MKQHVGFAMQALVLMFLPLIIGWQLFFGFPLIVLLGLVLPVVAILSLVRSHRDMSRAGLPAVKTSILWLLISQIAGGTLSVVFAPVLQVVAPNSLANGALTIAIWALGLLTPLAFAAAVWKFDVLSLDVDGGRAYR